MDYRRTKQKDNMVHMMSSSDDNGKIDARVHYVNMDNSTKVEPTQGNFNIIYYHSQRRCR